MYKKLTLPGLFSGEGRLIQFRQLTKNEYPCQAAGISIKRLTHTFFGKHPYSSSHFTTRSPQSYFHPLSSMSDTVALFNGMHCTDTPPGQVGRYKHLRPGSWVSARLLTYVFTSFPRLWSSGSRSARQEADDDNFQYNWRGWVSALEHMRKESGAWAVLAKYLVTRSSGGSTTRDAHTSRAP